MPTTKINQFCYAENTVLIHLLFKDLQELVLISQLLGNELDFTIIMFNFTKLPLNKIYCPSTYGMAS